MTRLPRQAHRLPPLSAAAPRAAIPGRRWVLGVLGLSALAGCATPVRQMPAETAHWEGRFALSYQAPAGQAQSTSATFELTGSPEQGRLVLGSPLGTALAEIHWSPDQALLQQAQHTRQFSSLEELLVQTLGTPIPIRALFAWLEGRPTPGLGWETDFSGLAQGRLQAVHPEPQPITLRVLLSR